MTHVETARPRDAVPNPGTVLRRTVLVCLFLCLCPGLCAAQGARQTESLADLSTRPLFASGSDHTRFGPFQLRGASPFQFVRVNASPLSGECTRRGQFLLNTSLTWNNRWAFKGDKYLVDGEFLHVSLTGTYGVTDWLQLRLEVPFGVRGGGFLDGAIMGFHDAFGYAQAGRDLFPLNRFAVILWRKDGTLFTLGPQDAGIGMEDMLLSAKFRLYNGSAWFPLIYAALQMQIPTGSEAQLWGCGCPAGALSLHLAKRLWRLYFYLDLQYTRFAGDELVGIPMEQNQGSVGLSTEWSVAERVSLVGQYRWNSGAASDFYEFSDSTHEVALGVKALIARETILSFAAVENVFFYDNSPDIAFFLGVSRRF